MQCRTPTAQSTERTRGRCFDPQHEQHSFQGLMIAIAKGFHSSFTTVHPYDNGYVGKQRVARKEYCAEYSLKKLQKSMDRRNGLLDKTEIPL